MSNPLSPSGSPAPPQEPSKKPLKPSEKGHTEEDPAEPSLSPTPEPGLRESPSPEASALDTRVESRSVSPVTWAEKQQSILERLDLQLKTEQSSPVYSFAKIMLLHDLDNYEQAHNCLDKLLGELPQDHTLYPLACFWRGLLLVIEERWMPTPSAMKHFEMARQHKFAGAIPFLMAENTGVYAFCSQVKWRNCQKVIRLLDAYISEEKSYQTRLSNFIAQTKKTNKTPLISQCCELIKDSTDCIMKGLADQQSALGFMVRLCQRYTAPEKEREGVSKKFEEWMEEANKYQPDQRPIFATYDILLIGMRADDPEPCYQRLSKVDASFPLFCAASIREKQFKKARNKQKQSQFAADISTLYLRAAEEMPMAFDALGEFLIQTGKMREAMTVYDQATARINDFLDGKVHLFNFRTGENAQEYRETRPEIADEIDLDELSACEEMLQLFEAKRALCEMVLAEQAPPEAAEKSSRKKRKKKTQTSEQTATKQPPSVEVPEPEQLPALVQSASPKKTPTKTSSPKTAGKEIAVVTEPSALSYPGDYKNLRKANRKIRLDADYIEAQRLLDCCSAPKGNPLWFKRKQHSAWLHLQESQDDQYLQKFHHGPELIKAKTDLLKKARKEVREGINKLVRICQPENQTDILNIPSDTAMKIAHELEQQHIGFRIELGSLYSTMGHILKAERDRLNPRTQREQCTDLVREANRLFQLSHRILGKRLS